MDQDCRRLPGILGEIEELEGREAALAVARFAGGMRVHLPTGALLREGHWLARAVGLDAAKRLLRALVPAGVNVDIPAGPEGLQERRRREMRRLLLEGCSASVVAAQCKVNVRNVYRLKRRLRDEGLLELGSPTSPKYLFRRSTGQTCARAERHVVSEKGNFDE